MSDDQFDAVVVGASLSGCTAAILLARTGVKVALIERQAKQEAYKHLCTHFIQASALPVIKRLGLDRRIEETGGVRNPIELHTRWGWVGSLLEAQPGDDECHGYNIRRLRLDPLLRALADETPGIVFMTGASADGLLE